MHRGMRERAKKGLELTTYHMPVGLAGGADPAPPREGRHEEQAKADGVARGSGGGACGKPTHSSTASVVDVVEVM